MDEQLKKILAELKRLGASTAEVEKLRKIFSDSTISAKNLEKAVGSATTKVLQLEEASKFTNESFRDLSAILKQNQDELEGKNTGLKDSLKFSRGLVSLAQKLQAEEEGITTLSEKELQTIVDQAKIKKLGLIESLKNLELKAKSLRLDEEGNIIGQDGRKLAGAALTSHLERLKAQGELTSLEVDALRFKQSGLLAEEGFVQKAQERLDREKSINRTMGLSGDAVRSLGGLMGKLGIESSIVEDTMKEAQEAMKKTAENGSQLSTALSAIGPLTKGFLKGITDPATIISGIVSSFVEVNKAQVDTIRLTGKTVAAYNEFSTRVASTSEVLATAAAATRKMGIDAIAAFGPELLSNITYAQHELGLTGDQATRLGQIASLTGKTVKEVNAGITAGAKEMNTFAKSGVPLGIVLQDVLDASDDVTASLGNNPKLLAKAATAARGLGLDLNKVNNIADGLLDFESSIQNELAASLLLGKNINLSKARELALNNDLEGVAKELANQGASAAEFANMNRVEQNALAKAMGMSRAELGKMVMTQQHSGKLTQKQRADIAGISVEQLKAEDIQHRLNRAMQQLGESFAPMLEALVPVVKGVVVPISLLADGIAWIFKKIEELIPATEGWGLGFKNIANFLAGGTIIASIMGIKAAIMGTFSTSLIGRWFKFLSGGFKKVLGKGTSDKLKESITGKGGDVVKKSSDSLSKVKEPTASGSKIKEFLTNLAAGLKAMYSTKVLRGALNLIPAGIGFVAFIPGMVGAKLMEFLDGEKLGTNLKSLAGGLEKFGTGKVLAGSLGLIAAGLGFAAFTVGSLGLAAIALGGAAAAAGIYALIPAMSALGAAIAPVAIGSAALAIFGAALIPLTYGLSLLSPLIESFGSVITSVFAGIGTLVESVAQGFVTLMDSVSLEKVGNMFLLGPALFSVAGGLAAFGIAMAAGGIGSFLGGGILDDLTSLTNMVVPLAAVSSSLIGVSDSLFAITAGMIAFNAAINSLETEKINELKGLVVTTAFAAPMVAATGAITSLINGITGSSTKGSQNAAIEAKLDELIAAVKAGGDVFIDGNKAGNALMLASYKTA